MMKSTGLFLKSSFFMLFLTSLLVVSCRKDKKNQECIAGIGGEITIIAKPAHHGVIIYNYPSYADSAFIKFNTQEFPGENASDYDLVVTGTAPDDNVKIGNLKCGKYFIYVTGFDTSIQERVKGGIPIIISISKGEQFVNVPVTED